MRIFHKFILTFFWFASTTVALAQVSNGNFSPTTCSTADVTWTNPGTVNTILIFAKEGSAITIGTPSNNESTYTANASFGLGTAYQGDAAAFCVYKSTTTGTTSALTGLTPGVTYHFLAYNVNAGVYSVGNAFSGATPALSNVTTLTTVPNDEQTTLSWTNASCFDEVLIVAKPTSTITGIPTGDGTTYAAVANFGGAGTTFDVTGKVVYKGTGTSVTVTGLTNGTTYFFRAFTRKGTTWSSGVEVSAIPLDNVSSGTFTSACIDTGTADWDNPGTVGTIVVFAKAGSAITVGNPTNNISTYTASTAFGSGTAYQNDASSFCVYKGTGESVNLTGLSAGVTYHFLVFNASGTSYSTTHTFNGSTSSNVPNITGVTSTPAANEINLSWTNPACMDEVLVVAKAGSAVTAVPTGDGSLYTANAAFASGTAIATNEFVVFKGAANSVTITALTGSTTYHFEIFTRKGTTWSSGATDNETTVDGTPPTISMTTPTDGAINIANTTNLVITFDENIQISSTSASGDEGNIRIFRDAAPDVVHETIARGSGAISINNNVVTINVGADFNLNSNYYVLIGNKVFRDMAGNNFAGISSTNTWNFTTSAGVSITAPVIGTCVNQFTSLGDIVITETGVNNFEGTDNGSFTLVLGFDKTGYIFNPGTTGVTATRLAGGDIQSITVTSVTFSQATFTIQFSNVSNDDEARNNLDAITISGLKVSRDGSTAPPALIVAAVATTLPIQGLTEAVTTLGTLNGGTVPSAPTITGATSYCVNTNFSGVSITASDPDAPAETFNWYNDAALSDVNAINSSSRTIAQLIGSSPAVGTYTRYVTQVDGCESAAKPITINVTALPIASAGPNLTGGNAVCSGSSVLLGGTPTATGGSGSYTYTWTGPGLPASNSNPNHIMPDPGSANSTYEYQVIVTDGNGCSSLPSTKEITVKSLSEAVVITQPSTFTYTTNNQPVNLVGSPSGGTFSGVGVTQLNGAYKFDPKIADVGNWTVTYSTTLSNGCPKSVTQDFQVTTPYDVFTNLADEYCNTETFVNLEISPSTVANIQAYIDNWNNFYSPTYGYGRLKSTFTGIIRNEYETYYGTNGSVQQTGGTYSSGGVTLTRYRFNPAAFQTDNPYPGAGIYGSCQSCYYANISVFIEFEDPNLTYPYNMLPGTDQGYYFKNSAGTIAAIQYSGEFVYVNPVPQVSFSGLLSTYCQVNTDYQLTGNKPGGSFSISNDPYTLTPTSSFGDGIGDGIKDVTEGIAPGFGEFNPLQAYGGAASATNKWIMYSVDPGTVGSEGQGCVGRQIRLTTIYPSDQVTFRTPVPASNTEFCYEGASFPITIGFTAGSAPLTTGVTFSGFGIADNGNGTGTFTPKTAFDQKAPGSNDPQTITITASYTNAQGCTFSVNRNFVVRPKPILNVSITDISTGNPPPDNNFCYNDASLTLSGNQPASSTYKYEIEYLTLGYTQTINNHTITFNPKSYYDDAVSRGTNNTSDATFRITYIVSDAVIGCTASSSILFAVSPVAEVTISGIEDGSKFCENAQPFPITFGPINGIFKVNGTPFGLDANNSISSSSSLIPIGDAVMLSYEYRSGVSQCLSTKSYIVSKIAAPKAIFSTTPACDGDNITYVAGSNPNNYSWKWILGDSIRSGTNTETINHIFPGLSQGATQTSYLIRLVVQNGAALLTCRDSTENVQVIGAYPRVDFSYADVCENDYTRFAINSNIPIASAEWNFGDSFSLPNGPIGSGIPGGTHGGKTQGTYGQPLHQFTFTSGQQNRYSIQLTARTNPNVGACPDVVIRQVAVLEKLSPTPNTPYNMAAIDNGTGLWIEEDISGFSTWEFATPSGKEVIDNSVGNVWITNSNGSYAATDHSFVNSPCFDLSGFSKPVMSLQYWNNTDPGKDGAILQYSINGGLAWSEVGTSTSGINWYSNTTISAAPGNHNQFGWTGRSQQLWLTAKNSLDVVAGNNNVRFRIAFASDEREEYDGFAFNNVVIEERNRIMLVEHFSNVDTDNPIIPLSNTRFNTHPSLNDSEIVKIQYHTSFPDTDPINSANPADHNARAAYYGITNQTLPLGFIDGGRDLLAPFGFSSPVNPNNGWWNDFKQKRSLNASPYTLTVETLPSASAEELTIRVSGSRIADVTGTKPILHVGVIEKDVMGNQHVMRKLFPNASGTSLDPLAININETFLWKAEGINDLTDLAIIAFIQDELTKEVHQAAIDLNPANLPTDIITSVEDPEYAKRISLYPNPANTEVHIELPAAVTKPTPVAIVDAYGRTVHEVVFAVSEKRKTVPTTNLADGVYLLQITTPAGAKTVRKMLVKH